MVVYEPASLFVKQPRWDYRLRGVFFAIWLLFSALVVFLLGSPIIPLIFFAPRLHRRVADGIVGLWLQLPCVLLRHLYGFQAHVVGHRIRHDRPALIIMNHRTSLDWMYFWPALSQMDPRLLCTEKITMKSVLRWVPGAGWAMQVASYIFLRRQFAQDEATMARHLRYYSSIGNPYQVLIFPEGTDKCPKATARSSLYAQKNGLADFKYLLQPRVTGFVHMIQEMRRCGYIDFVYDVTIGFGDRLVQNELDLLRHGELAKHVHFRVEEVAIDRLPADDEGLKEWLMGRWAEKEKILKSFYDRTDNSKTFEMPAGGQDWPLQTRDAIFQNILAGCLSVVINVWALGLWQWPAQRLYVLVVCTLFAWIGYRYDGWERITADSFNPPP
ncbi:unnamed protein product, partial [Mesorhabditis spiculigera]